MKGIYLLGCLFLLSVIACNKGSQTKPVISVESITQVVPVGGGFETLLKFTESSGKLGQGTFAAIRHRLNQQPLLSTEQQPDDFIMPIPAFPDKAKGELDFTLTWNNLHESDEENDTIVFKIAVTDRLGNVSDTIVTPQVVILYQ
ncbi:MAG TPA: hypothetical protein VMH01_13865 [Puia sp.]|nr:hypothetical protein [Puia sp.]